jgi:catechol 2,3-dioxygenase-like lactoylglutathione lyase family enzyme
MISPMAGPQVGVWYARPVFFVSDLKRSLTFYLDVLQFTKKWHEGDGTGTVCQVNRSDCEIILTQDPARSDKARLFLELDAEGLAEIRRAIDERSIPHTLIWWGYDVIRIADPDGNELFFCAEL